MVSFATAQAGLVGWLTWFLAGGGQRAGLVLAGLFVFAGVACTQETPVADADGGVRPTTDAAGPVEAGLDADAQVPRPDAAGMADLGSPADLGAPGPTAFAPNIVNALDALVAAADARHSGSRGVVLRVESGTDTRVYGGAAGTTSQTSGEAMTPETTFEIASTSKAFTAVALLLLVEDGRLGLDDRIDQHLPAAGIDDLLVLSGQQRGGEITPRQLLAHRSGLPHYWEDGPFVSGSDNAFIVALYDDPDAFWTPQDILAAVKALDPIGAPGQQFHYADGGYLIAGMLIEALSGMSLHAFYRDRIFGPLGITSATLSYREPRAPGFAHSHLYWADDDRTDVVAMSADWAGGGLIMNAHDLARFAFALETGGVLNNTSLTQLRAWSPTDARGITYGLGLYRVDYTTFASLAHLGEVYGHDGYGGAFMYIWPSQNIVLSGTLNHGDDDCFDTLIEPALQVLSP